MKEYIPEVIKDMYRAFLDFQKRRKIIFKGVYQNFESITDRRNGFDGDDWVKASVHYTKLIQKLNSQTIPGGVYGEYSLLPFLISTLRKDSIRILDFGGATGFHYESLTACKTGVNIDYTIVETGPIVKAGKELHRDIRYVTDIPFQLADILIFCGSLQYSNDYRGTLEKCLLCNPVWVLFTRIPAGDVPTYATKQINLKGWANPAWIFNLEEIVRLLREKKYDLVFKGKCDNLNQRNFKDGMRLEMTCNLLFRRN